MDNWLKTGDSLRVLMNEYGTNNISSHDQLHEPTRANRLPKASSFSPATFGGLITHQAHQQQLSSRSNFELFTDAQLLQNALRNERNLNLNLLPMHQQNQQQRNAFSQQSMPSSVDFLRRSVRMRYNQKSLDGGPPKKKLKTQNTSLASVLISSKAELMAGFPLPSLSESSSNNTYKPVRLVALQNRWDRLECESDTIDHDTDASQEAVVKECFLRQLYRYRADHLKQRCSNSSSKNNSMQSNIRGYM